MTKSDNKTPKPQTVVKLTLIPGTLTPAQKAAGRKLWARLIAEVKANAGQPVVK